MGKRALIAALVLFSACGAAFAADEEVRQTVSVNTPNPSVEAIDEALFPKAIGELKSECAQMEKSDCGARA